MMKWPKNITPALVEGLISSEKDLDKALSIFDAATAEYSNGFRHDHSTFGLMIRRLLSANRFLPADDMLVRMKREKCDVTEGIFLSILRAYARVHKPHEVLRVFGMMKDYGVEPTAKSYVTVFSILVNESQLKMAFRFYRFMRQTGVPVSVASLNVLIKALCKSSGTMDSAFRIFREMPNRGHTPDSYTYGTLINGLCRAGRTLEAKELLIEMEAKNCSPTVVTYSCLIHGFCQLNRLDDALQLLKEMKSKSIEPNVYTYSSLIDGLCKNGHSLQAMKLFDRMVQKNLLPNFITYSSLIYGLCKEGKIHEAVQILDRMKLQDLKPDAGLYSKIIIGFCEINKFQKAANFLDEMVLSGITPNRVTWGLHVCIHNRVIQGLCSEGHPNQAFQLYLSLRSRGISVEAKTFESLIHCFCKKDLYKAVRIVEEMVTDRCIPDVTTWNSLLDGFWDRKKVREAAELLHSKLMDEFQSTSSS
ncbi:pentatricopeptide repeat-containing protein At5g46100 [Andrographis paniculata]|uniref:pentatricopeptide repeat-containing protein At5g46100 n=1 Tax=Andrographis paniculata TaxID=175694 RepID=UPI0021E7D3CE|nr:pentatricopeptide repeat-containing protein At5g46100 [Andrographis paniculata]